MIKSAQGQVARFTETARGCPQALVAALPVPEMGDSDKDTSGNMAGFVEMARRYNYTSSTRCSRVSTPARCTRSTEHTWTCATSVLAIWVDDASESVLVFDFLMPRTSALSSTDQALSASMAWLFS